jgi:hypothetical protein
MPPLTFCFDLIDVHHLLSHRCLIGKHVIQARLLDSIAIFVPVAKQIKTDINQGDKIEEICELAQKKPIQ